MEKQKKEKGKGGEAPADQLPLYQAINKFFRDFFDAEPDQDVYFIGSASVLQQVLENAGGVRYPIDAIQERLNGTDQRHNGDYVFKRDDFYLSVIS